MSSSSTARRPISSCGKPMVVRASKMGAFWGCTGYPKCKNLVPIEGAKVTGIAIEEPEITEHLCPHCNRPLALRKGRFGPFLGCTGYPECKTIIKVNKEGDPRWDTATSPLGSAKQQAAAAEKEAKAAARIADKEAKAAEKEAAKAAPKTVVKKTAATKPAAKKAPAKKAAPAPAQKPVTKKSLARAKAEAEA